MTHDGGAGYWVGAIVGFTIAWAVIGVIGWTWWLLPMSIVTLGGMAWWTVRQEIKKAVARDFPPDGL